jgi:hypothetical protein
MAVAIEGTFKGFVDICEFDRVRREAVRFALTAARSALRVATGGMLRCRESNLRRRGAREGTGAR